MVKITKQNYLFSSAGVIDFIQCPQCNRARIRRGDKYCSNCGVELDQSEISNFAYDTYSIDLQTYADSTVTLIEDLLNRGKL